MNVNVEKWFAETAKRMLEPLSELLEPPKPVEGTMVPLRIQVLFHWESTLARSLAQKLYCTFSAAPTGEGPRIPVRYGPQCADGAPPDVKISADHEILVILVDERMARRARQADGPIADQWGKLVSGLVRDHGPNSSSPHRVLPVALDNAAVTLTPDLNATSFVRLDVPMQARDRHLVLHVAVRALRALRNLPTSANQPISSLPEIPVNLFISHAKKDLPSDPTALAEGPVKAILAALTQLPIKSWYDAAEIPAGGRFSDEIRSGVLNASALVAVLTDTWSSREWCRREILEAKMAGRPLVIVDALQSRVVRLFPYIGNATTLRWRAAIAAPAEPHQQDWAQQRQHWEAEDARLVIETAVLEALRYQHEYCRLMQLAGEDDVTLGTPPEALTLAHVPPGKTTVWYPDPPLGQEELEQLQPANGAASARRLEFLTPLGRLARWQRPRGVDAVAVSLSNAPDTASYGGSLEHLARFADDIVLYLLIAGLRVAYGGVLGHGALTNGALQGDDINYVDRLLCMARSHAALVNEITRKPVCPIENWVAWPIHLGFGNQQLRSYGQEAKLRDLDRPPDLDVGNDELDPPANGYFKADTPARRYAWARSLTFMRESMREATSARIVMGGKLTEYTGLWPGVLEEAVISLRARQTLFPVGLFGGAARLLIDALQGRQREELTTAWVTANVAGWNQLQGEYVRRGHSVQKPEELADELKNIGAAGMAGALNNGLTDEQNAEFIASDDPQQAVTLILEGLRRMLQS
jgi:hypothetical protein